MTSIVRRLFLSVPKIHYTHVAILRHGSFYMAPKKHQLDAQYALEEQAKLANTLQIAASYTKEDWENLASKMVKGEIRVPGAHITASNVDGVILRLCTQFRLFESGISYFDHLRDKNTTLGEALLSRYLKICSMNEKYAKDNKDEIISIYKSLKGEVLEPNIAERCISVICLYEDYWKDSFELLEAVKKMGQATPSSYFSIVQACFTFGEIEKGWDVLATVASRDFKPKASCYLPYISYCEKLKKEGKFQWKHLERLFLFLEEYHLKIPSQLVVNKLDKFVHSLSDERLQWSLKETFVPRNGGCSACRRSLAKFHMTSEEFEELRRSFIKKAIVGSNVFLKTTPEEVERFKNFLNKCGPYDVVIDGLNVAYSRGANRDLRDRAKNLQAVVAHFVRKNMKVLVLGRLHMKKWPKDPMDYVLNYARMFFALDLSQDDPFLLYAALRGGPSTYILSRDLMRSHIFTIDDLKQRRLFRSWLVAHTYTLGFYNKFGVPSILPPLPYRPNAQKLESEGKEVCWHLPYDEFYAATPPEKAEPPPKWLCITGTPKR